MAIPAPLAARQEGLSYSALHRCLSPKPPPQKLRRRVIAFSISISLGTKMADSLGSSSSDLSDLKNNTDIISEVANVRRPHVACMAALD